MRVRLVYIPLAVALGCGRGGSSDGADAGTADPDAHVSVAPKGKVLQAAENEAPPSAGSARAAAAPAKAKETVDVPGGKLVAGSTPGDRGRDPVFEPALLEVELGGFSIDRFLYPNDPAQPALTGVTRARAAELCAAENKRLCTELEWERACKGPDQSMYAGGAAWDAACGKDPASCASAFGVLGMGAALREWTASDVAPIEKAQPRAAAVRGARADANAVDHRCAKRAAVDPGAASDDLGFRCCGGPPNAASIPSPQWQQTFRKVDLTPAQAKEMFASVEQLAGLDADLTWFKEPDDTNAVLARADGGAAPANTILTTSPLLWSPVPGEEVLVVAGRAGKDSFVVAFHRLPDDRYRIASSFVMKNEKGPVVLGFNGYVRRKLQWAICWDCPAESGNVTYRDDNRVVITQK
jgi:hypothetical protein